MALLTEAHKKRNEEILRIVAEQRKRPVSLEEAMAQYEMLKRQSSRREKPPEELKSEHE